MKILKIVNMNYTWLFVKNESGILISLVTEKG